MDKQKNSNRSITYLSVTIFRNQHVTWKYEEYYNETYIQLAWLTNLEISRNSWIDK